MLDCLFVEHHLADDAVGIPVFVARGIVGGYAAGINDLFNAGLFGNFEKTAGLLEACIEVCERRHQVEEETGAVGHVLLDRFIVVEITLGDCYTKFLEALGSGRIQRPGNCVDFDVVFL